MEEAAWGGSWGPAPVSAPEGLGQHPHNGALTFGQPGGARQLD